MVYHISFAAHRKNQLYPVFSEVSVTQLTFLLGISTQINLQTVDELVNYKALANKKVLMALLNLFKDWVFLIEPRRSFHNGRMERSIAERGECFTPARSKE